MKYKNLIRKYAAVMVVVVIVTMTTIHSFAVGAAPVGMDTSITAVKDDALASLAVVAPIGITIFGAYLVWKFGIRFFKGLAK